MTKTVEERLDKEKKRRKKQAWVEWRQDVRVTAVEAFDLRFLIDGDYSLCACVSPDYCPGTKGQWTSRPAEKRHTTPAPWLKIHIGLYCRAEKSSMRMNLLLSKYTWVYVNLCHTLKHCLWMQPWYKKWLKQLQKAITVCSTKKGTLSVSYMTSTRHQIQQFGQHFFVKWLFLSFRISNHSIIIAYFNIIKALIVFVFLSFVFSKFGTLSRFFLFLSF